MSNRTKNWIGHTFVTITVIVISISLSNIARHNAYMKKGKEEVLGAISGQSLKKHNIKVTYQFAHGIDIMHANELESDSKIEPDFSVTSEETTKNYVFVDKVQTATFRTQNTNFTLNVLKNFDGKLEIKNTICGCEALVNMGYFVGGAATSLFTVLLAAGFYYSAKNNKNLNETPNEKEG